MQPKITWHKGYGPEESDKDLGGPGDWYAMMGGQRVARASVHESTPTGYWGRYRLYIGKDKEYPATLREAKAIVARKLLGA